MFLNRSKSSVLSDAADRDACEKPLPAAMSGLFDYAARMLVSKRVTHATKVSNND